MPAKSSRTALRTKDPGARKTHAGGSNLTTAAVAGNRRPRAPSQLSCAGPG